jgi:hypothetical protein
MNGTRPAGPAAKAQANLNRPREWTLSRDISRRNILRAGAGGLALTLISPELASSAIPSGPSGSGSIGLAYRLARLIASPEQAASLGSVLGPIREPAAIMEEISDAWGVSVPDLEGSSDRALLAYVIDNHALDAANGNFVIRNGWILSRTEAGLYEAAVATAAALI